MKLLKNRLLILCLIVFGFSCNSQKVNVINPPFTYNCNLLRYLENDLNIHDTSFKKVILFRLDFCGNELCSDELYESMEDYVLKENKKVLIILSNNDSALFSILSKSKKIKTVVDVMQKFQKFGFQRPGHYAFLFKSNLCPIQYINIDKKFIQWYTNQ